MRPLWLFGWMLLAALTGLGENPGQECAGCHQALYDSYQKTAMARASGVAAQGFLPGEFTHALSGVHYRLSMHDGEVWLSYDRGPELHGEQRLSYFIGSGQRGRTYLFQRQGFWFESPVNWYSKGHVWDMNPKSLDAREMPFTLKVDGACLHCHTSGVQPATGANNHFGEQPFLRGGVTCASCHGDPAEHLAKNGKAPILNPAKLPAARRDSVCLQCHLEGEIAVNAAGQSLTNFRPGDNLDDFVRHFVHGGELGPNGRATSQWEALLQSECKRKSGDRLTCTTCHDPHSSPQPSEKTAYFRSRCLSCHAAQASHHAEQPDCASCHMPRQKSQDVAHEQVTDHRIQRRLSPQAPSASAELTRVGGGRAGDRELGLAYFQLAKRGDRDAAQRAIPLLQSAKRQEGERPDADLHTALGFMAHLSGDARNATKEYLAALRGNPFDSTAATDLAILEAKTGEVRSALDRLAGVSENDPGETIAGMDLAVIACAVGDEKTASQALARLLAFSPDDRKARQMLQEMKTDPNRCLNRPR
jgi:predicted CXXCH cytochrome family protein